MVTRRQRQAQQAQQQQAEDEAALVARLLDHPSFQLLSVDRSHWLHPYSGRFVSAPFEYREVARKLLLAEKPWRTAKPKPMAVLQAIRWLQFLRQQVPRDPRLRIFQPGRWLNPFTGDWVEGVEPVGGRLSQETIQGMARALAACPQAQQGQLLSTEVLQAKLAEHRRAAAAQQLANVPVASAAPRSRPSQPVEIDPDDLEGEMELTGRVTLLMDPAKERHHAVAQLADRVAHGAGSPRFVPIDPPINALLSANDLALALHGPQLARPGRFEAVLRTSLDQILLIVGEVGGRDDSSARFAPRLISALPELVVRNPRFADAISGLNLLVREDFPPDKPVKVWVGLLDPAERSLQCASAGHESAFLVTPDADPVARPLGRTGPVLGRFDSDDFLKNVEVQVCTLSPGSALLVPSAELCQIADGDGHPIGLLQCWGRFMGHATRDPQGIVRHLVAELGALAGREYDEAAPGASMIVLRAY